MTGACSCEKFPLRKGGSAEGAGVVLAAGKVMLKATADWPTAVRMFRFPGLHDNPRPLRPAPFSKGEFS